mgnify:CR=1 FL=1
MSISVLKFSLAALNHYSMPTILSAAQMLEWIDAECKDYDLENRYFHLCVANNSLFVDKDSSMNELLIIEACLTVFYPIPQIAEFKAYAQNIKLVPNFYQMPAETQARFWNDKCALGERKYLLPYKY